MIEDTKIIQAPLWYKDAIFYEVRVRSFFDHSGNGLGDFRGLAQKLDYIKDLGITTIWILPFYSSPMRDDGYDISDYTNVHPDYGNLHDFKFFLKEAHKRDLRVVTELVINHTSIQHPWFQRARNAKPGSKWRNFYVWSDTPERYKGVRIIFKDFEKSNWAWDETAQAYYWHRFYSDQPDLNFDHPEVAKAIFHIVDFWFKMGIDGFRLDAVPYLFEREGTSCENLPQTHAFLKQLKKHVAEKFSDRMLLAEANQWPEDAVAYFGDGDECDMAFHFPLMPRMFMALQMEDRFPLIDILQQTPPLPEPCQWALFLRNHDELTLEMVTDEERDYMYRIYAHDPRARLNLGIRRRLAPLLDNDRRKIELMNSLLFSLPGTPVIYYGDEIGMGDNIYLGDRDGVRTPMQWNSDRNAGFSKANPQKLYLPVIVDPEYHYNTVNVENQQNNPNSLLLWMKRLISVRKKFKAFGRGSIEFLEPKNHKVLAFIRRYGEELILVVANFSRFSQYVELDLSPFKGAKMVELFGGTEFPVVKDDPYFLTLGRHSYYWFSLVAETEGRPPSIASRLSVPLLETKGNWEKIIEERRPLEKTLPDYLRTCHWFAAGAREIKSVAIADVALVSQEGPRFYILFLQVDYHPEGMEKCMLPLACAFGEEAQKLQEDSSKSIVAKVVVEKSKHPKEGVLFDAFEDKEFYKALLGAIFKRRMFKSQKGHISALTLNGIRKGTRASDTVLESIRVKTVFDNAAAFFDEKIVLKIYRRLQEGVNPDLEIGSFLTKSQYSHSFASIRGSLEYKTAAGGTVTLGILQGYVKNQGNAWQYTLEELEKYFEEVAAVQELPQTMASTHLTFLQMSQQEPPAQIANIMGHYLASIRLIGMRTAEMHSALTSDLRLEDFAPEPFTPLYQRGVYQTMRTTLLITFEALRKRLQDIPKEAASSAKLLLESEDKILKQFKEIVGVRVHASRIRCNGNYQLSQLLYTGKDFVVINFEGDASKTFSERKIKVSPLRDLVTMICSFSYASATALKKYLDKTSPTGEKAAVLKDWANVWHRWASAIFLQSYFQATGHCSYIPQSEVELNLLINVFLCDRAICLLSQELTHNVKNAVIPVEMLKNWFL